MAWIRGYSHRFFDKYPNGHIYQFFSDTLPLKTSIVLANGRTKHMETYRQEGDGFKFADVKDKTFK